MIVGTVREVKTEEHRVGLTPEGAHTLALAGHTVLVETNAGVDSGYSDASYVDAGAEIVDAATDVWAKTDLMVKVKEPQPEEFGRLRPDAVLFTYLHLAAAEDAARALIDAGTTAIAYETVEIEGGMLPLLVPMSQVAGRLATEIGAQLLRRPGPGRGKLLSGLPGAEPARVVILGAGTVSTNACAVAVALGARVTLMCRSAASLRKIEELWPGRVTTMLSTSYAIGNALEGADLLIAGVLITGAHAPSLVSREQVRSMGEGAVIVDVDIDQGGCIETARPTTHADPTYVEEGVVHYGVANMPGSVPVSSTRALTAVTLPYVMALANGGIAAIRDDPALMAGVNVMRGKITHPAVAEALGMEASRPGSLL